MRAAALAANEDLIIDWARAHGKSFHAALGAMIDKRIISRSAHAVRQLNFDDPNVCGDDLKYSLLYVGKFSKNKFTFKQELRQLVSAKSDSDLNKKIVDYEFSNPLMLLCAMGAQFDRHEKRYLLDETTFLEAYAKKCDQFNVLVSVTHDLYKFGLNSDTLSYITEFCSEMVNTSNSLEVFDDSKERDLVNDSDDEDYDTTEDVKTINHTCFNRSGADIQYNVNDEMRKQVRLAFPMSAKYESTRRHFGISDKKSSLFDRFCQNENIKFCDNGACWEYNFGHFMCPHASPCQNRSAAHLASHYCAICHGDHPLILCPFIRCFMFIASFVVRNWMSHKYDKTVRYPSFPHFNERGRGRGGRGGRGRGKKKQDNNDDYYQDSRNDYGNRDRSRDRRDRKSDKSDYRSDRQQNDR